MSKVTSSAPRMPWDVRVGRGRYKTPLIITQQSTGLATGRCEPSPMVCWSVFDNGLFRVAGVAGMVAFAGDSRGINITAMADYKEAM